LNAGPVVTALVIPGCNDGRYYRGGNGGTCEQRTDDGACLNMRGCSDNYFMKKYEHHDIIMSDEENRCRALVPETPKYFTGFSSKDFTHDTTIVGSGSQGIVEFWLIKQSWGTNFAQGGY
jgi:hypothetical protein